MDSECVSSSCKDKRKEWKKSVTTNDITKSLTVEELDNGGFLIRYNKYGEIDGKYEDITKKFYSETNPLATQESIKEDGNAELEMILSVVNNNERIF